MVDLERHSRHILLPQVGAEGQNKLSKSRVLCLGAGGLGSPVIQYLAAAGIGHLTIVDDDVVEISNLQSKLSIEHQMLEFLKHNLLRDMSMNSTLIFQSMQLKLELTKIMPKNCLRGII